MISPMLPTSLLLGRPYLFFFFQRISASIFLLGIESNACSKSPSRNAIDNLDTTSITLPAPLLERRGNVKASENEVCSDPTKGTEDVNPVPGSGDAKALTQRDYSSVVRLPTPNDILQSPVVVCPKSEGFRIEHQNSR